MKTQTKKLPRSLRLRGKPINARRRPLTTAENAIARALLQVSADDDSGCNITALILKQFNFKQEEEHGRQQEM